MDEEEGGAAGRDAVEHDTVEREGDAVEGVGDAVVEWSLFLCIDMC